MFVIKEQFQCELHCPEERRINIAFEGMSGAGKSFWSERVAEGYGYPRCDVDTMISEHASLTSAIANEKGTAVQRLAGYLGLPHEENFREREKTYLEAEQTVMTDLPHSGHLLDLSGSSVYHADEMEIIRANSLVIYLQISERTRAKLIEQYLLNPKPICWNNEFEMTADQTVHESYKACFGRLIDTRAKLYEFFADVTIPETEYSHFKIVQDLTAAINDKLE